MAMMTVDEYIASLQNFKNQHGGDAVILCFDRLLEKKEVDALNGQNLYFDSVYIAIDQLVNQYVEEEKINQEIHKYDTNGNLIHYRNSYGFEEWQEYDSNGNLIHYRNSKGFEDWFEYDTNGKVIHHRNNNGFEYWYEYDTNGNYIHYRASNGFESWREYDTNGNCIHYRDSNGLECWYDADGNVIDNPNKEG